MSDNIFVKQGNYSSLEQFARSVCGLLNFGNIEEHHSANYWGEQYFVGFRDKVTVTIAASDDAGFESYSFWISVKVAAGNDSKEEEILGDRFARILTLKAFEVARPYSPEDWLFQRPTVKRLVYAISPLAESLPNIEGEEAIYAQVETTIVTSEVI